jgi:hypothetical protein
MARDLADLAAQLASLNGEANAWFNDPMYDMLRFRVEEAHFAAELGTRRPGGSDIGTSSGNKGGLPTGPVTLYQR